MVGRFFARQHLESSEERICSQVQTGSRYYFYFKNGKREEAARWKEIVVEQRQTDSSLKYVRLLADGIEISHMTRFKLDLVIRRIIEEPPSRMAKSNVAL